VVEGFYHMKFVFHIGPHKTGSTAIQRFLQLHKNLLRESGVFVPTPLTQHLGTHEIPWAALGWDLRLLGAENSDVVSEDYFDKVLLDAENSKCESIVFSSEDFSLLGLDQWGILLSEVYSRAILKGLVQFQFVSVRREIGEYVASQYKTLVLLGLSKKFDDVKGDLESHFSQVHKDVRKIPGKFDEISEVTEISYASKGIVSVFLERVFPRIRMPDVGFEEAFHNRGYPDDMIEIMREWNVGTGVEFHNQTLMHWPVFHTLPSVTRLSERRQQLFGAYDALVGERDVLVGERDVLVGERDALLTSNSWKITRPLRAFGRLLRRESVNNISATSDPTD
jgi:hypothetical protein